MVAKSRQPEVARRAAQAQWNTSRLQRCNCPAAADSQRPAAQMLDANHIACVCTAGQQHQLQLPRCACSWLLPSHVLGIQLLPVQQSLLHSVAPTGQLAPAQGNTTYFYIVRISSAAAQHTQRTVGWYCNHSSAAQQHGQHTALQDSSIAQQHLASWQGPMAAM